ncbi:MAG: hypothetical protein V3R57_09860 [Candidatus Bathyarchaeia archaeon]
MTKQFTTRLQITSDEETTQRFLGIVHTQLTNMQRAKGGPKINVRSSVVPHTKTLPPEKPSNSPKAHDESVSVIENAHFQYTYHINRGDRYVPLNETAKSLAAFAGLKTLSIHEITFIMRLNLKIKVSPPDDETLMEHYKMRKFV